LANISIANLHVRRARQPLSSVHRKAQQLKQRLAGLFVRQRQQRTGQLSATRVNIPPLTRLNRLIIVRDPRALGLKARRQVGQRPRIQKLTQRRRRRLRKPTN
jgi:hypothetical protein